MNRKVILLLFIGFFLLRTLGIFTDFSNSDALRWHNRSEDFALGLKSGNLKETYQRYHPGVSLMWISFITQSSLKIYSKLSGTEYRSIGNVEGYILDDGITKILIVVVLAILLLVQFRLITRLFNTRVALLFLLLMSLEPYLVGIDRWYHLTSLESYLSFTAFLYVLEWRQSKKSKGLLTAGILMGFALLTRFSGFITLAILALLITQSSISGKKLKYLVRSLLLLVGPALFVVILFFPALWVAPWYVLDKILNAASEALIGDYQTIPFASTYPMIFYLVVILVKLSPLTIILFLAAVAKTIKTKNREVCFPLFYVAVYLLTLTFADQKIERYIILIVPAILLIIAQYLSNISRKLLPILATVILVNLAIYLHYYPFPSLYYSPVTSGVRGASKIGLLDTNGEYYAQSAFYLNAKGRDTVVYLVGNKQSFTPYFKGKIFDTIDENTQYIVTSSDASVLVYGADRCNQVEKVYQVDGLDYLTILKCASVSNKEL